jgi:hypothetical protein
MSDIEARIRTLAKLQYEAASPRKLWEWVVNHDPDTAEMWLNGTRALYAEVMKDAAGVARERDEDGGYVWPDGEEIAEALEDKAQEASNG